MNSDDTNQSSQVRADLLALRPIKALIQSPAVPLLLQVAALVGVVWLSVNGWGIGTRESGDDLMTLRKTNLTTLFVWGLWWPGMIAVALLLGRAWCTACPMELVNRLGYEAGRRTGLARVALKPWVRAGWLIVGVYLVLQLLVAGLSIHRVPHYTAIMLLVMLGAALVTGIFLREPRSFCKSLCPAAALLSVYGRFTPVQLDAKSRAVCDECETKDCTDPKKRFRLNARSCPSFLRPYARQQSDGCVLCLECAKVCPHENIGFGFVKNTSPMRQHRLLKPFEAVFVMFAAGFVGHEVIGEVKVLDGFFHAVPKFLNEFAPAVGFGWFEALWFLVFFPLGLWLVASGVAYAFGHRQSLKSLLLAAATGAAPVVAVAHLAKAVAKVSSWGGFLPLALRDPAGTETLHQIAHKTLASPAALTSLSLVGWLMLGLVIVIGWRSLRWTQQAGIENLVAARAGMVVMGIFYSLVLGSWPWL